MKDYACTNVIASSAEKVWKRYVFSSESAWLARLASIGTAIICIPLNIESTL